MGKLTPVDIFQEGALRVWSDESDLTGVWFDGHEWSKWWPTLGEIRESSTHMPLVLLSLEESDLLWFKLDRMSPNLWQFWISSLEGKEYRTSYFGAGRDSWQPRKGPDQSTIVGTKQICTMTRRVGSHALRVEGSLVYRNGGTIFSSMSQVFVDDLLAGEAIMTAVKGPSGTGAIHRRRPAYVSIGGLLLAVFAPKASRPTINVESGWGWGLAPPDVEIWLETTEGKLAGIPVTDHRYDSFAPNDHDAGLGDNFGSNDAVDRYVQVRGWIEEMSWLKHKHAVAEPRQLDRGPSVAGEPGVWP
jgi:hypothetical protein